MKEDDVKEIKRGLNWIVILLSRGCNLNCVKACS